MPESDLTFLIVEASFYFMVESRVQFSPMPQGPTHRGPKCPSALLCPPMSDSTTQQVLVGG